MSRRIDWLRLDLEGFGVWREPARFRFPERLGVCLLPNERGKSTLLAGLRASLFGLRGRASPEDRGIGRYRSWGSSGPCRAALVARFDDRRIRFRRDFLTHDAWIDRVDEADNSLEPLFAGNANPEGRNPSTREHESLLRELLGELADEELFAATFLVEQPVVPAGETDEALGLLVSGVGRVGGEAALARLFEEVKGLTRLTGDLGLTASPESGRPTNQRTDGAIERRRAELDALESTRAEAITRFDRLVELEDRRDRAAERFARAREELGHAEADLERIGSLRRAWEERDRATAARDELRRAGERLDRLAEERARLDAELAASYADLRAAPVEMEEPIEAAVRLEESVQRLREEGRARREEIERIRAEMERTAASLPEPARGASEEDPAGWIIRARETAARWRSAAGGLVEADERAREARAERARLSAVAVLPEEVREALARFDSEIADLERREMLAIDLEHEQTKRIEEFEKRSLAFSEKFGEIVDVDPASILPALEERAALLAALRARQEEVDRLRAEGADRLGRRVGRAVPIGLAAGALAGAVAVLADLQPAFAGVLFLAVGTAVARILSRPGEAARAAHARFLDARSKAAELSGRLASLPVPEGPWMPDDERAAERARRLLAERDAESARILEIQEGLPHPDRIEEAAREGADSRGRREWLRRQAEEVRSATGLAPEEAIRTYRERSAALLGIETRRADRWKELAGAIPFPEEEGADPLSVEVAALEPVWSLLPAIAGALGRPGASARTLLRAIDATPADRWEAWAADARALTEARARARALETDLESIEGEAGSAEASLKKSLARIGAERIEASSGSPARLRERHRAARERSDRIGAIDRARTDLLEHARGGPFPDAEELRAACALHDDRRRDRQAAIDRVLEESALARSYLEADPGARDRIARELAGAVERLRREREEAGRDLEEARSRIGVWEPVGGANVAALDLEIQARRREIDRLQERRDAAADAWHLLRTAIARFAAAHRRELQERLNERFGAITGRTARRVLVGERFEVGLLEDGVASSESQLSQGARDQLAVCLRVVVAELVSGDQVLPLFLDDPFVHSDAERLVRIGELLRALSRERQILLLTQDERLASWGEPVSIEPG